MGDARIYSQTVNISAVQNRIIELVMEGNHNRRSLAKAMGANYDSLCRHIRLLIADGVLCEHEKGRLGIAPLDQEVG
jgi:predicted transcriptional regulator